MKLADRTGVTGLVTVENLALLTVLGSMALGVSIGSRFMVLMALVATVAIGIAAMAEPTLPVEDSATATLNGALVLVAVSLVMSVAVASDLATPLAPQFAFPLAVAAAAAAGVGYVVFMTEASTAHRWIATGLILAAVAAIGWSYLVEIQETNLDVFLFYRSAAAALANGENPYVVARALDSSPLAEPGAVIIGYPYPPLVLLVYSVFQWLTGDPRWASVVAVATVVVLVAAPWAAWTRAVANVRLTLALLFVTPPAFGIMTLFAWSEPISLPFLFVAGRFWSSKPVLSAVALGLAVATKQYFVLALPLLLLWPDEWRWRRTAIVGGVALATMLPFLLLDAGAFISALTNNTALTAGPRPDSTNLVHLGLITPLWVAIGGAVALAVFLGRRGGGGFRFTLSLAAVLSVSFFLGVVAFRNYWFLIGSMALIGLALRYEQDPDDHGPPTAGPSYSHDPPRAT